MALLYTLGFIEFYRFVIPVVVMCCKIDFPIQPLLSAVDVFNLSFEIRMQCIHCGSFCAEASSSKLYDCRTCKSNILYIMETIDLGLGVIEHFRDTKTVFAPPIVVLVIDVVLLEDLPLYVVAHMKTLSKLKSLSAA